MNTNKNILNELKKQKKELYNMLNQLRELNKNVVASNKFNKNVTTWMNSSLLPANKNNIPVSKRAYLKTNMRNGKINTVYNRNGLKAILASTVNRSAPSPLTRKPFTYNNIVKYPPRLVVKLGKKKK